MLNICYILSKKIARGGLNAPPPLIGDMAHHAGVLCLTRRTRHVPIPQSVPRINLFKVCFEQYWCLMSRAVAIQKLSGV